MRGAEYEKGSTSGGAEQGDKSRGAIHGKGRVSRRGE
jgi:hypothetical protein